MNVTPNGFFNTIPEWHYYNKKTIPPRPKNPLAYPEEDARRWYDYEYTGWNVKKCNIPIYHGCGNATPIYEDMVEIKLDSYNPLEVKAGLDIVELKKKYGGRLAFTGNIDVRSLESGDPATIKKEVLYKLQAGIGGGFIFQSDHSVSSEVAPESYAYAVQLVREYGNYPLDIERVHKELACDG